MSRYSLDNNNFPYDNNVLVLDMVLGSLWGISQPINWDNVAKLVPGFSPSEVTTSLLLCPDLSLLCDEMLLSEADVILQCAHRFEELKLTGGFPLVDNQCNAVTDRGSSCLSDSGSAQLEPGGAVDTGGSRGAGQWSWSRSYLVFIDGPLAAPSSAGAGVDPAGSHCCTDPGSVTGLRGPPVTQETKAL